MSLITIRYTWQSMFLFIFIGVLLGTTMQTLRSGIGFIVHAWLDLLFWSIFVPGMLFFAVCIRYVSAIRLYETKITSFSYPFKIQWTDLHRCTVCRFLGILHLKLYGVKSRFPIWLPLQINQIEKIYAFLEQREEFSAAFSAFEDIRLKAVLQRSASRNLGRH